ncbi:hypothetical protein OS189_08125 [Sulfitobacter sp. F26169L]|uniref:hypothetical protein n=1 Tax=Sulfitobacter sp. F26169L TaxID=2996015 RepID=UPI0022608767|nr:hypothetical protein [Sulfitobacter sp. F26169L]MCX7566308.1 hypothetical protein [Sulfitobacter sp. F26169L]
MPRYEYKVVAAPSKGIKGKGVRGAEARFSYALQELMNGMAGYGWEYQRAETLPSIERSGIAGSMTEWRNVLVFRRLRSGDAEEFQPELLPAPPVSTQDETNARQRHFQSDDDDEELLSDNGVEDTQSNKSIGPSLSILARARSVASTARDDTAEKGEKPET